jgi:hypothetical protein
MTQQIFNPGPSSLRTARMLSYRVPRPTTSFPGPSPSGHSKLGLGIPRLGRDEGGEVTPKARQMQVLDALQNKMAGPNEKAIYNDNSQPDWGFGAGVKNGLVQGHDNAFTPNATYDEDAAQWGQGQQDLARGGRIGRAAGGEIPDSPNQPFTGPIVSNGAGRADNVPMHVPPGAYVLPADVVSHMGEGNSIAGLQVAHMMFGPKPFNAQGGPYGAPLGKGAMGKGMSIPKLNMRAPRLRDPGTVKPTPAGPAPMDPRQKHGGMVPSQGAPGTPIAASGGEFVVRPDEVKRRGNGDINKGHKILDAFVKAVRADHIKTLQKMPGPAQD